MLSEAAANSSGDAAALQIESMVMVTTAATEHSKLNRLRAAAALIPIIQSDFADKKLSRERAVNMISFIEWTASTPAENPAEQKLLNEVIAGLSRLKDALDKG